LPAGVNFRVNVSVPARQGTPGAVWDGRDAIFAAWEDGRNGPPDIYAISIFPDGSRRGTETQLNDDAAPMDQRRPRVGRGPGRYLATWLDFRDGRADLYGQWITSVGGRDGTNHRVAAESFFERPVDAASAVSPTGAGLIAAQLTREADAGEIRGFLYSASGTPPVSSFWISDQLPSAQSSPAAVGSGTGFGVVWIDTRDGAPRVYGQRLASNGARIGGNHPVLATEPAGVVAALDLDLDPSGGYWLALSEGMGSTPRLWAVHLDSDLAADRPGFEIAPSLPGERISPTIGVGADRRVEITWLGEGASGLGQAFHQAFDSTGAALTSPTALGLSLDAIVQAAPSLSVAGSLSIVTWEARDDGDWSIWMQALEDGATPITGVVRVDQDVLGADQLDPTVGLDASGHATLLWADSRSPSSGIDIVGRAFSFIPTAISELPEPPPAPSPDPIPPPGGGSFTTGPARPNPFAGAVGVPISSPEGAAHVSVRVYNARGQVVATLHDGPLSPGARMLRWNGRDSRSRDAGSGIYWIVAEGGGERHAMRVVQLR
ncbi:MAG: FlgD immunoglobulin-like domain containing protein, partial [bacterium]